MTGGGRLASTSTADVDFFSLHNRKMKRIDVDMLDYAYVEKCTDVDELKGILALLRSGKEGRYPHLETTTEERLLALLPTRECERIRRMRAEPTQQELATAADELLAWSTHMDGTHTALQEHKKSAGRSRRLPPVRGTKPIVECGNKTHSTPTKPSQIEELPDQHQHETSSSQSRAIPAYDFRAWEQYDVDQALEAIDAHDAERQAQAKQQREAHERRDRERKKELASLPPSVELAELSSETRAVLALREKQKGNECFRANENDEAVLYYTHSLAFDDANAVVYANRAAVYLRLKSFAAAEQDCSRAVFLDPTYAKGWSRRGMTRFRRGKYAEAATDFAAALKLEPGSREVEKLLKKAQEKHREVEGESRNQADESRVGAADDDNDVKPFTRFAIVEESDAESDEDDDDDSPHHPQQLRGGDDDDVGEATSSFQRFEIIEE